MRTYRLMLMTEAARVFYPDEPAPTPAPTVVIPELPAVEEPVVIPEAKVEEPKPGDPPKEEPKVEEPKVEETPEAKATREAAEAAAKVPEAYELKAGEGVELDAKMVEQATPIFKALGLNNEQAQQVVDLYQNTVLPEVAQTVQNETLRLLGYEGMATWAKDARADKEIGGADFEKNLSLAATARDKLGTPEFRKLLETTRLGNHPEMLRMWVRMGKAIGESAVAIPDPGKGELTGAEALYGAKYAPKS